MVHILMFRRRAISFIIAGTWDQINQKYKDLHSYITFLNNTSEI